MLMPAHLVSNLIVATLLGGVALLAAGLCRAPLWRAAARALARRRPLALAALGLYALVALLDSVSWVDARVAGDPAGASLVNHPRTLIDRLFPPDFQERSYAAPLAEVEFYGGAALQHPGAHLLGTDIIGRDVLHQTLRGARVALLIGGLTSLIAIPLALLLGVSAGWFGGRVDDAVFFMISTLASMPGLLLLVALVMVLGTGTAQVCIALGVTGWVGLCRLVRAETLKLRELDYIAAARVLGATDLAIVRRHILPNLAHLVLIGFVLMFSGLVLSEVMLSWLGLGLEGSWGRMIDQARTELSRQPAVWWNLAAASTALFGLILAVNLVADALRDVLDPRTATEQR